MADQVLLYISAASDLEAERDILGRAVARIPIDLGWRIEQSPRRSDPVDLDAVSQADVHVILMGSDIRAPVGTEWIVARRAGRQPSLFLKQDMPHTMAAVDFIRFVEAQVAWQPFKDGADLRRKVLRLLAEHILDQALHYSLSITEMERLQTWRAELEGTPAAIDEETRGGAGESSVILSKERFVPSQGVLIRADEGEEQSGG